MEWKRIFLWSLCRLAVRGYIWLKMLWKAFVMSIQTNKSFPSHKHDHLWLRGVFICVTWILTAFFDERVYSNFFLMTNLHQLCIFFFHVCTIKELEIGFYVWIVITFATNLREWQKKLTIVDFNFKIEKSFQHASLTWLINPTFVLLSTYAFVRASTKAKSGYRRALWIIKS